MNKEENRLRQKLIKRLSRLNLPPSSGLIPGIKPFPETEEEKRASIAPLGRLKEHFKKL